MLTASVQIFISSVLIGCHAIGKEPSLGCKIAPRCAKGTFRIVPAEDSPEGLMLLHCLENDRMRHMMPGEESEEEEDVTTTGGSTGGGDGAEDSQGDEDDRDNSEAGSDDPNLIGPFPDAWLDAVVQVSAADLPFPTRHHTCVYS